MSVLSVDDKNYENPGDYVERNKYFFTSDLPAAQQGDSKIPTADLQAAVSEMMTFDSLKSLRAPSLITESNYASLKANLDQSALAYSTAIEDICLKHVPGEDEESKALLKEWRKGIHCFLREKLTFGMPGPSSSQVMSVLGYEECCRRIGGASS